MQTAVTKEALFETLKEFRDLHADRPMSEEEFEKARLGLIRGYPPTFETPGQVLRRLIDIVHYGLPDDYFAGQVARLQAVTLEDVHRVAAEHVDPEALSIVRGGRPGDDRGAGCGSWVCRWWCWTMRGIWHRASGHEACSDADVERCARAQTCRGWKRRRCSEWCCELKPVAYGAN